MVVADVPAENGWAFTALSGAGAARVMISTSVFEDQASEEESNKKAAEWVQQNDMAAVMPNPPHITAGGVVSYKTK
jgi:hypothetical protein